MSTSAIQHIVAMPANVGNSPETPFQGFSLELYPNYLEIISALVHFPHDMLEAGLARAQLVGSKMTGSDLNIRMIRVDLIDEGHCELEHIPTIIWSTTKTAAGVDAALVRFRFKPLHLTLEEHEGAVTIASLTPETIYANLLALSERAAQVDEGFKFLVQAMRALSAVHRDEGQLPFAPGLHNSTGPLADVLGMYGYQLDNAEILPPAPNNLPHIKSMLEMTAIIDGLRKSQPDDVYYNRKNDAIIYCPSIQAQLYKVKHWNHVLRNLPLQKRNFVKNFLLRNKGYSNGLQEVDEMFDPYQDAVVGPMLMLRQFELRYFAKLVSVLAANQFVPALRLPNAVMLHHDMLTEIYALVTSNKKTRLVELNSRLTAYGSAIHNEIGQDLLDAALKDRERLLLICDFPLEWLPIDLVPAMFRYDMSRIPSTPGNVTNHVMFAGPRLILPCKAFMKVLVIRSFSANDPIRDHLSFAVKHYPLEQMIVEFVDVTSTTELIESMNRYDGAMLVFDCHGNHGGKTEHAWLHIGRERVDVWKLANVARMPPIVILAACSTHPLDGSHASVANGFLRSGVLSVLGTYAPVLSINTAILVARLLYRVAAFLPMVAKNRPCTWREIVSVFLRMSYTTDVLRDLRHTRKLLTEEQFHDVHLKANMDINSGEPGWLDNLQRGVIVATGKTDVEIKALWAKHFQFVETMLFAQLGRPENIIIVSDEKYFNTNMANERPPAFVESNEVTGGLTATAPV